MQPAPGNPHGSEDPLNAQAAVVIFISNAYLHAILTGDPKAIDEASRNWESLADKE